MVRFFPFFGKQKVETIVPEPAADLGGVAVVAFAAIDAAGDAEEMAVSVEQRAAGAAGCLFAFDLPETGRLHFLLSADQPSSHYVFDKAQRRPRRTTTRTEGVKGFLFGE